MTADFSGWNGIHWLILKRRHIVGIRFGRSGFRLFSERHQGTRNLPIRFRYFLGGRITIVKPTDPRA